MATRKRRLHRGAKRTRRNPEPSDRALDAFYKGYVEAALFTSTDDRGRPLDKSNRPLGHETVGVMMKDAYNFLRKHLDDVDGDYKRAGIDFWLTRNGHGAGFWDGDWPEPAASRLTKAAKAFGEYDLYIGDDGRIHGT